MGFWKTLAGSIVRDVVKPELEAIAKDFMVRIDAVGKSADVACFKAQAAVDEVKTLRKQMAALMALDVSFKEAGKVILLTRIGDQDRVKILDVKPEMTALEYKTLVERLKVDFGVGDPVWVDKPAHMDDVFVGVTPARKMKAIR